MSQLPPECNDPEHKMLIEACLNYQVKVDKLEAERDRLRVMRSEEFDRITAALAALTTEHDQLRVALRENLDGMRHVCRINTNRCNVCGLIWPCPQKMARAALAEKKLAND